MRTHIDIFKRYEKAFMMCLYINMFMKFSQIIKKLRLDADMTQERLSEFLSISPQAVSRWETGIAMPDISLLPPLANLFHVTTDYLLGMDEYERDERRAKYEAAYKEYWKMDDKEACYQMAAKAAAEYPGEMKYLEWLAASEYYLGMLQTQDCQFKELLNQSISHYKIVLKNADDRKLWDNALHGIVLALHYAGKLGEAKEYARMQEDENKRDDLLSWCLEGEEKAAHSQKMLDRKLTELLTQLRMGERRLEACEAAEQILKIIIPDENYLQYHSFLQYNCIDKALLLCRQNQYDDVMEELKKARFHAEEMTKFRRQKTYQYTAPLLDRFAGENEEDNSNWSDLDDFFNCLKNNRCFDSVRDRVEFQALTAS